MRKVGEIVGFKYDIEQYGPIVKIERDFMGVRYFVKATEGGYVKESGKSSQVVMCFEDELWD
jgi:hypothetical protein